MSLWYEERKIYLHKEYAKFFYFLAMNFSKFSNIKHCSCKLELHIRQDWALMFLFFMDIEYKYCHPKRGRSWKYYFP